MGDQHGDRDIGARVTRREALTTGLTLAAGGLVAARAAHPAAAWAPPSSVPAVPAAQATPAATPEATPASDPAAAIAALAREAMEAVR